ncbi:MAG: hypothetical protein MK193_14075 [Lentisphaeria bacterium]|nr:hypothetical protein [Lentisphaeria bacterium]
MKVILFFLCLLQLYGAQPDAKKNLKLALKEKRFEDAQKLIHEHKDVLNQDYLSYLLCDTFVQYKVNEEVADFLLPQADMSYLIWDKESVADLSPSPEWSQKFEKAGAKYYATTKLIKYTYFASKNKITQEELIAILDAEPKAILATDREGNSVLHTNRFDATISKLLIDKGANVQALNHNGETIVHTYHIDPKVLELYLQKGADPNVVSKNKKTALMYMHDLKNLKLLLKYNATHEVPKPDKQGNILFTHFKYPIHSAVFLTENYNIDLKQKNGNDEYFFYVLVKHLKKKEYLTEFLKLIDLAKKEDLDFNQKNKWGKSFFTEVSKMRNTELRQALLEELNKRTITEK